MAADQQSTVLHYLGYDDDRGGIVSVIRALAEAGRFTCVLGMNAGAVQRRVPALATMSFTPLAGETISWATLGAARRVAGEVRAWLRADATRVFHGHSRAGLLVGLCLALSGERRVVVTVHCHGHRRWLYRLAAAFLGRRLFVLTGAMRAYYGMPMTVPCIPSCAPMRRSGAGRVSRGVRLRLGGAGTLARWKGWHLVVEALTLLPDDVRTQLQFTHIGSAGSSPEGRKYGEELKSWTKTAGLENEIRWLGEQASSAGLLSEIDVLLVASDHEPFSVIMLEALAAGVPVLAADSGGPVEVVRPPVNGWLFRTGDAADLSRMLRVLVENPQALGEVRIDHEGLQRYSAPVVAIEWAQVYAERCAGARV